MRDACVALNAFAQSSIRHERLFLELERLLPARLHDRECDMRQLAMMAHAHVRVSLSRSSLLPLVWDRARDLAPQSDAHGLSLALFALTKASAVCTPSGRALVAEIGKQLLGLLSGSSHHVGRGVVEPATIAVTAYSLARGGCIGIVEPALWSALALQSKAVLSRLSLTEAANVLAAFAKVAKTEPVEAALARSSIMAFADELRQRIDREVVPEALGPRPQTSLEPAVAAKLIASFGELRCSDAAPTALRLARRCVARAGASWGAVPLRGVAEAMASLRAHDEDLLQALALLQRPSRGRARAPPPPAGRG